MPHAIYLIYPNSFAFFSLFSFFFFQHHLTQEDCRPRIHFIIYCSKLIVVILEYSQLTIIVQISSDPVTGLLFRRLHRSPALPLTRLIGNRHYDCVRELSWSYLEDT
jgi:hypothetical protein